MFNFFFDALRLGLWQVHFVQDGHHLKTLLNRGVAVGYRLRLNTLPRIHHQQRAFTGRQRTADLIGEVNVAGGINEVELVGFAILRVVMQRYAVRFDGDAALTLQIHGIQDLGFHFTVRKTTANLDETVGQGGFTVVDVRDDGKIADMTQITHRLNTQKESAGLARRRKIGADSSLSFRRASP